MINRFLRAASTRRLLGTIGGVLVAIAGGTAIAIAAQGGGPVPRPARLANALHKALRAHQIPGISADITFTNHLINASLIQGPTDPLLSGGSGHLWVSGAGQLRIELYGDNGDPAVVVNKKSWWVSDPMMQTVYEGTLPKGSGAADRKSSNKSAAIPTISQIQTELNSLAAHLNISKAVPTDVAGQPTYTVRVSPKHDGGLLGDVQLAWDAIRGVPLDFAIYARGDSTPVLGLEATNIAYGHVDRSIFSLSPPSGYKVVKVASPVAGGAVRKGAAKLRHGTQAKIAGAKAVATKVPFKLVAPAKLVGLPRQSAKLLELGDRTGALITYGQNLGGIAVIEQGATNGGKKANLLSGKGDHADGVTLPGVSIDGTTGQELDTALGTIVRFTRGGVTFTVLGSLPPYAADAAARGL